MGLVTVQPRNNGIGMYPTNTDGTPNPCYDPNRPSWMPGWWDTWSEGKCFYLPGGAGGQTINPVAVGLPAPEAPGLDSTISSLAGIAIILGVVYLFAGLYLRKGR